MAGHAQQSETLVEELIASERLVEPDDLVLAAVSGGQDSMAMAAILHTLSTRLGFRLAFAHFDHMLREDSAEDAALVEGFARRLSLPCYRGREDVGALARESHDTIEEAARKARYRFLEESARTAGADRIATGHTSDDQVETVLMRILHGTGIRGLAGIPVKRGRLIRPILRLSRDDTARYCSERDIAYRSDPTNRDIRFMRNRVRHTLIPLLKNSFHPGVEINLLNLCGNAQALLDSFRDTTGPVLARAFKHVSGSTWILDIRPIKSFPPYALFILFSDIFADHLRLDMDFTRTHYEMLAALCGGEGKSGKRLSLPGVEVKREFDSIIFTLADVHEQRDEAEGIDLSSISPLRKGIKVPGTTTAPGVTVVAEIERDRPAGPMPFASDATTAYFSLDAVTPPLTIRTPAPGDRIRPFGMSGTKKLSDIFIDKKIPGRRRARSLVISDANEILWVVGVVTGERFRVTPRTRKILKLQVTRE